MHFLDQIRHPVTTLATAITLSFTMSPAQADPFDGFFNAGSQATTGQGDALAFFEAVNGGDADIAERIVNSINFRVAAMRLANKAWWAASDEDRDAFLDALAASLTARVRGMDIQAIKIAEIQPADADRVVLARGEIILQNAPPLAVTWALREDQGRLRIIAADTVDGTFLLPDAMGTVVSQAGGDLAATTDMLRATIP